MSGTIYLTTASAIICLMAMLSSSPLRAQVDARRGHDCLDFETNGCVVETGKIVCESLRGLEMARSDMNAAQLESLVCVRMERDLIGTSNGRSIGAFRRLTLRTETKVGTVWARDGDMERRSGRPTKAPPLSVDQK